MTHQKTENDHLEQTRVRVIEAALPEIAFDGWSKQALERAISTSGVDKGLAHLAFPRGGMDLLLGFHRLMDDRLARDLESADFHALRMREKIAHAVMRRMEMIAPHREAVRRGAAVFAMPFHAIEGSRAIWRTADVIWNACGDRSQDYNWYSKRAILASVYSATLLFWLGDDSPDYASTRAFLDRRIENVMQFENFKGQLRANPLTRAALWAPRQILGLARAPNATAQTPRSAPQGGLAGALAKVASFSPRSK